MRYREIIIVCNDSLIKHISTSCEQNVQFFNIKPCRLYSNYWALQG